jgi:hypothetical protein
MLSFSRFLFLLTGGIIIIIAVIDGQGGGIGSEIIKGLRQEHVHSLEILALGTNSTATSRMMKAGANRGATGENAIIRTCIKVDVVIGPLAIIISNSMMGEATPQMTEAICASDAKKILIPLTQENVQIVGVSQEPLPHLVARAVKEIREI